MSSPPHLILSALREGKEMALSDVAASTGLQADAIRRVLVELSENGFVLISKEKIEHWILTRAGEDTLKKGSLPEQRLCDALAKGPVDMNVLRGHFSQNPQEFSAAFGLAKRSNWIRVESNGGQTLVSLTPIGEKSAGNSPVWHVLLAISRNEPVSHHSSVVAELQARGLIGTKVHTLEKIKISSEGKDFLANEKNTKTHATQIGLLTPQILTSGAWKNASFKPYDVTLGVEERVPGKIHPLRHVIRDVRQIMVELGFEETESPLVESAFWNMDVMFIPQDHPARDIQDTFYLPGKAVLPNADLTKRVKAMHEHGGKTGSKGFGYEWDPKIAMQLLLRTHGSATTFRTLAQNLPIPSKTFSIGRVFRNEAIDATHLAEFYQVDGLVMGEGLSLRHLMGIITEFYARLGLTKIKFKPTFNPYTEPSMEALAYHPGLKKWVEIINSGMFRPETLAPLGITVPVISWGFGLERLALFLLEKNALKEITGPDVDLDFIRNYSTIKHTIGGDSHGKR
jgi:phenylalanyl-tRNA synthetase alpha chain